jgi:hypothetical protein
VAFLFAGIKNNTYIRNNKTINMPEIFRFYGFSFFFYSREHEPLHIHVEGNGGMAKFDLVEDEFVLKTVYNIKSNDLKKIKEVIDYNKDIIIKHWIKYFGKED